MQIYPQSMSLHQPEDEKVALLKQMRFAQSAVMQMRRSSNMGLQYACNTLPKPLGTKADALVKRALLGSSPSHIPHCQAPTQCRQDVRRWLCGRAQL